MVDLEPLDAEDADLVGHLLRRHVEETGSAVAGELLADWPARADLFTKVMPRDYKSVLLARARAIEEGLDIDATIMAVAHG
jgi:glutamate synthase (NADPH) large chain